MRVSRREETILPTAEDPKQITIIDLNKRACPNGVFTWTVGDGIRIRSDGLHFTPEGVQQWIAPWLLPQLADVAYGLPPQPPASTSPTPSGTRAAR